MAKTNKEFKTVFDPENLKVVKQIERDTNFWPFEKQPTLFCEVIGEEKLEYDVYRVRELMSGEEYYIPSHNKIETAVKESGGRYFLKIVWKGATKFDGGKKTYNSYEIDLLEKQ